MRTKIPKAARAVAAAALALAALTPVQASVTFENLPSAVQLIDHSMSRHGVAGPILVDDFVPALGGHIKIVEWWGSAAPDSRWELAFHTDNPQLHQPNIDDPFEGAFIKFGEFGDLNVLGVQDVPGHADIWHYTAVLPIQVDIAAGEQYWFTVANFTQGWHWAYAFGGATVGSENYNAHVSTGVGACQDGGPHCGPWTDVHTDFAFRMSVPEPGTFALAGLALAVIGLTRSRRPAAGPAVDAAPAG